MFIVQNIPCRFIGLYTDRSQALKFIISQFHLLGENAEQYSAAVAIRVVPIIVPPGTYCCWVDRGGMDSEFAQGFYT